MRVAVFLFVVVALTVAASAEVTFYNSHYIFRPPDRIRQIRMWVPPEAQVVRGVIIWFNHGGANGVATDVAGIEALREFGRRFGFAVAGTKSYEGGSLFGSQGAEVLAALREFAVYPLPDYPQGRPELGDMPIVAIGGSNGAMCSWGFANYAPQRVICFGMMVGSIVNPYTPTAGALLVPGLMVSGELDNIIGENGAESQRRMVNTYRPNGARWVWFEQQNADHEGGDCVDLFYPFIETCIRARYPEPMNTREGPAQLRTIPEEQGWLVDASTMHTARVACAPYNDYDGDKGATHWVPDAGIAHLLRGMASYDNQLSLSGSHLTGWDYQEYGMEAMVAHPGETATVSVSTSLDTWARIALYNGASLLGETQYGSTPFFSFTVSAEAAAYGLTAVAYDAAGGIVALSEPSTFVVAQEASMALAGAVGVPAGRSAGTTIGHAYTLAGRRASLSTLPAAHVLTIERMQAQSYARKIMHCR